MKDKRKKKKVAIFGALILVIAIVLGITYALSRMTITGTKNITVNVGDIVVAIDENSTDVIAIQDAIPVTDSEGASGAAYKFTVRNTGTRKINYAVYLDPDTVSQEACNEENGTTCNLLPETAISYQLKQDSTVVSSGTLSDTTDHMLLGNINIYQDSSQSFELRIWLNLTADNSAKGKYYFGRIRLDATETLREGPQLVVGEEYTFQYTGSPETFKALEAGKYKLEVWGAQGGYRTSTTYGGKGGYSVGTVTLEENDTLYVYVGGAGKTASCSSNICEGGYNGGGYRYMYPGGGGATDIRFVNGDPLDSTSLLSRLIVAGGGGSDGASSKKGMQGGGTTGGSSTESCSSISSYGGKGGTQTYSGYNATYTATTQATTNESSTSTKNYYGGFGFGGFGIYYKSGYGGAGGGGWYGGSGNIPDGSGDDDRGGGGGSGFVFTAETAANTPSGYSVNSKYYLADASTLDGTTTIPSKTGTGTATGNSDDGYAKITYLGK